MMSLRRLLSVFAALFLSFSVAQAQAQAQATTADTAESGLVADAKAVVTSHTEVAVGAYILRLSNVSPRTGTFDVDMWVWFHWKRADVRPDKTFEIVNGVITKRSEPEVEDDDGVNYSTMRVQATIFHNFDVHRFPLDNHVLTINFEDANLDSAQLTYSVDQGIALEPGVEVSGWKVAMQPSLVTTHVYNTTYGARSKGTDASKYSRLLLPISLDRTSYEPLFKSFWISGLSVLLSLLALLLKADNRVSIGVGAIFAASASSFAITNSLPPTTTITLAEQINLISVGIIFVAVFVSIWSLRLRNNGRDDVSLALDHRAIWVLGATYIVLNTIALTLDLSGGIR
jgi:hypothetical protein